MRIHKEFCGGNIVVKEINGNIVILDNELRDTTEDWFYWAFCVEGAENQTYTFCFQNTRVGYWGPAVSYDLVNWHWLNQVEGDSFTYHFGANESKVYFAHSMLYHPNRFQRFAEKCNINVKELCKGYKGSSVPYIEFGDGATSIFLTARHHACESTGNYVMEGVLEELIFEPIPDTKVFCVPFVDYEGVIRGDQGKMRVPHDHNRDYDVHEKSIYPECNAIKEYAAKHGCHFAFDFHSPWHYADEHDNVFIVQNSIEKIQKLNRFGELLEKSLTPNAFRYEHKNDIAPEIGWNKSGPKFAYYMKDRQENNIAFTLETAYFGTAENKVSEERLLELGRCFAKALKEYIKEEE